MTILSDLIFPLYDIFLTQKLKIKIVKSFFSENIIFLK